MGINWSIIVASLGARGHYSLPAILASHNRLERFYTDSYLYSSGFQGTIRKIMLHSPIKRIRSAGMRNSRDLPDKLVSSYPLLGFVYAILLSMFNNNGEKERLYVIFSRYINWLHNRHGYGKAEIVYGLNTASLEWFKNAKLKGLSCVLEQCSAPYPIYDRLANEEHLLWPNWERDKAPHQNKLLFEREAEEWKLADLIICGSEYVMDGLVTHGVSWEKCTVVPYSVNVDKYYYTQKTITPEKRSLKVLFLGSIRIMKGIQYFSKAIQILNSNYFEAKAAGSITLNHLAVASLKKQMDVLGPIPRDEVPSLLDWADVLVLPSICEGSALVTYEALAAGVPVITTTNAGSPVIDGITGFIVPIRDSIAIAEKLDIFATKSELLQNMSTTARQDAMKNLSYQAYSERLMSALNGVARGTEWLICQLILCLLFILLSSGLCLG